MAEVVEMEEPRPDEPDEKKFATEAEPVREKGIEEILADAKANQAKEPVTQFVCALSVSTGFVVTENVPPTLRSIIQTNRMAHLGPEAGTLDKVEEELILAFATIEAIQGEMLKLYAKHKKFLDLREFKFPGGPG